MNEYYVVVADNDKPHKRADGSQYHDSGGALVFEQYLKFADLENIKRRVKQLSSRYGKCRIAKLKFIRGNNDKKRTHNSLTDF